MPRPGWIALGALGAVMLGCDASREVTANDVAAVGPSLALGNGVSGIANGGGHYALGDLIVQFGMSAVATPAGPRGQFHQSVALNGLLVEFHGRVTCMAVDPVTHRAWIGGVVTKNNSTHPDFQTAINQPGRDVWFRVVDYAEATVAQPDRTTFLGFEGAAGIITSEAYCQARLWPDLDARTWPVTGNITVRP